MSPLTGAAMQAVSPQEGGLASGVSSTTRQIGAVLGVAVLGAIVHTRESGGASFDPGGERGIVACGWGEECGEAADMAGEFGQFRAGSGEFLHQLGVAVTQPVGVGEQETGQAARGW